MRNRYTPARLAWLVGSFVVVGVGVALMLATGLGTDGYTALVNGLTLASGQPFALVNLVVGVTFITVGWLGGLRPDVGTVMQPLLVGPVVGLLLPLLPRPTGVGAWALFAASFVVLALGASAYLATDLGIGPTEAPAIAFDPPVPFVVSYFGIQAGGCLVGFLCGADVGLGTLLVVFGLSPVVDRWRRRMPQWRDRD